MDNAAKGFLIAGVLIILIITITIIVNIYSKGKDITKKYTDDIDKREIDYHNSQFSVYDKGTLNYAEVIKMLKKVVANNTRDESLAFWVKLDLKDGLITDVTDVSLNKFSDVEYYPMFGKQIKSRGTEFAVSVIYNEKGIIDKISIKKIK